MAASPIVTQPPSGATSQTIALNLLAQAKSATASAIMASPPTRTQGTNNANSTIVTGATTGAPTYLLTSTFITPTVTIGQNGDGNYEALNVPGPFGSGGNRGWGVRFMTDAEAIDFQYRDLVLGAASNAGTITANTTSGSATLTVTAVATGTSVGLAISGTNIPAGTFIGSGPTGGAGAYSMVNAAGAPALATGTATGTTVTVAASGMRWRARVNGQFTATSDYYATTETGGAFLYDKLDFGASSGGTPKLIELFFEGGSHIKGINAGKSAGSTQANNPYRIWTAPAPGPSVLVLGDSYTYGNGAPGVHDGWAYALANSLGAVAVTASGVGGTGYINTNSGNGYTLTQRVAAGEMAQYVNPSLIVVALGINDTGQSQAAETAAAITGLTALRAAQPLAIIAVMGPWRAPGLIPAQGISDGIKAAVTSVSGGDSKMFFVDTFALLFQDTASTATAGSNASVYVINNAGADTVHPNAVGHLYLAQRAASAIISGIQAVAGAN